MCINPIHGSNPIFVYAIVIEPNLSNVFLCHSMVHMYSLFHNTSHMQYGFYQLPREKEVINLKFSHLDWSNTCSRGDDVSKQASSTIENR